MITDETMREIVLKEKKKLFMRLWMVPWIGLTCTLILIIFIQWIYYNPSKTPNPPLAKTAPINSISSNKDFYISAVESGHGEFKADKEGKVYFDWKPLPTSTESVISSQVQCKVNIKLKGLQELYKTNAIEVLEKVRKETSTECLKGFQIGAVSNGVGKWIADINGLTEFRWKSIPEIVYDYTCTESNRVVNMGMTKRDMPFTYDNYRVARNVGIDIEGELIKRVSLSIETVFWGNVDKELKERVRVEVSKSIHGMFDGFESLNKIGKGR
jgi:hypothetical protein